MTNDPKTISISICAYHGIPSNLRSANSLNYGKMFAVRMKQINKGIIRNLKYLRIIIKILYLEFLSNDSICGSPPWLTINTADCEIAENKKITVFKKDFLNSISALTFVSSSKTYFNPI